MFRSFGICFLILSLTIQLPSPVCCWARSIIQQSFDDNGNIEDTSSDNLEATRGFARIKQQNNPWNPHDIKMWLDGQKNIDEPTIRKPKQYSVWSYRPRNRKSTKEDVLRYGRVIRSSRDPRYFIQSRDPKIRRIVKYSADEDKPGAFRLMR